MSVQIIKYSEKSIAVIGYTKEIKEEFKINGSFIGRFNKFLKIPNEITKEVENVAGWIFSLKNEAIVVDIVEKYNRKNNSPFFGEAIPITSKLGILLQKEEKQIFEEEEDSRFSEKLVIATEQENLFQ